MAEAENEVLERLREFLKLNHWSIYRLANSSGVPYSSLNNCFLRNTCPTIPTLEKLCAGLNISLSDFFDYKTNPLRDDRLSEDEQNLLALYRKLSIRDKELLNAYLDGLSKKRR
ncbi:MAG: helix-turn-helix domain-containing protein [Oscillospiraceae bacterium]|nr:helix-turn-helix domain-containing protein [Oscillospiraceae bacterium]